MFTSIPRAGGEQTDTDKQRDEQIWLLQTKLALNSWLVFCLFVSSLLGIPLIPVNSLYSCFNLPSSVGLQFCVCYYISCKTRDSDLEQEGQVCPLTVPSTPIPRPRGLSLQV